jgi:hypothetical protein
MDSFVDSFCKRDGASDCEWLFQFGDDDFDASTVQTESNACSEVTAAAQEDKGLVTVVHSIVVEVGRSQRCFGFSSSALAAYG